MLFMAAIEKLSHDELVEHVANLETLQWARVARELAEKKGKEIEGSVQNGIESTFRWISEFGRAHIPDEGKYKEQLHDAADKLNLLADTVGEKRQTLTWEPYDVSKQIMNSREALVDLSESDLRDRLIMKIAQFAGYKIKGEIDPVQLSEDSLERASAIFQDKVKIKFTAAKDVEKVIFRQYVERLLDNLKAKLDTADDDSIAAIEEKLREQLGKLSSGDAESLKEALDLQKLTSANILSLLKKGSITAGALLAADATGFGIFLFLTTLIKSFSLLLGVTFTFATYTAATTALGFLLGPVGGSLLVGSLVVVSAGIMGNRFNSELLAGEIFALHCKLIETESE